MPYPWALGFWFVWPWIVVTMTAKYWQILSGEEMPKDRINELRKNLRVVARSVIKKK